MYFRYFNSYPSIFRASQSVYLKEILDFIISSFKIEYIGIFLTTLLLEIILLTFHKKDFHRPSNKIIFSSLTFLFLTIFLVGTYTVDKGGIYPAITRVSFNEVISQKRGEKRKIQMKNEIESMKEDGLTNPIYKKLMTKNKHQNQYTGIYQGKNLLVIQIEGLQNIVLNHKYNGEEITPFLNQLIGKQGRGFYFTNYFQMLGLGNSSDAEFVSIHSIYPNTRGSCYEQYSDLDLYGLPKICNDKGYYTLGMHGNTGSFYKREENYPKVGFKDVKLGEDFTQDEIILMGLSDKSFFRQSIEYINHQVPEPYFAFMVTLSSHTPFNIDPKYHEIPILPEDQDTIWGNYINGIRYLDRSLQYLFEELEERGMLDNTVIAMYGDHHAMSIADPQNIQSMNQYLGREYRFDDMMNIPLIIYCKEAETLEIKDNIGSHLDFLPTILNLMGWTDVSTPMFGVDLLDEKESANHIVPEQTYMLKGSFITDDWIFEISRDGVFKHSNLWDRKTGKKLDVSQAKDLSNQVIEEIDFCQSLLDLDMGRELIKLSKITNEEK
ncbi:MAG: LTA synthase family protein [Tissierellia bacterium]|nr:LTA synthase family protein [Tissierellia bacterium]